MFRQVDNSIYVNTFALEVYLPFDYMGKAYRGYEYYSLIGSNVRYFAVGMMRPFNTEKELENPISVKCYPLGMPMRIDSSPSSIDIHEIQFTKNGPIRKCIVLTYYKGDVVRLQVWSIDRIRPRVRRQMPAESILRRGAQEPYRNRELRPRLRYGL